MKNLLIIFTMCAVTLHTYSQVSIGLAQDFRLLVSDDDHGNKAPTLDATFHMNWWADMDDTHRLGIRSMFEYADLAGGSFFRYSVHGGLKFDRLALFGYEFPRFTASVFSGVGAIHRDRSLRIDSQLTWSFMGEIGYNLTNRFSLLARYELLDRTDLEVLWNDGGFQPQFSIGFEYVLN